MVLTVFFFFANIRKLSVILGKCFWQWCCIYLCWTFSGSKLNPIVQRTRKENATVYHGWYSVYGVNKLIKSVSLILDTGIINHYNYKYVYMYILSSFTLASANNSILNQRLNPHLVFPSILWFLISVLHLLHLFLWGKLQLWGFL